MTRNIRKNYWKILSYNLNLRVPVVWPNKAKLQKKLYSNAALVRWHFNSLLNKIMLSYIWMFSNGKKKRRAEDETRVIWSAGICWVVFTNYIYTITKQLLRFTDLTMDEISVEVGMDSANYFSRAFHKVEGISPSEYRKQW